MFKRIEQVPSHEWSSWLEQHNGVLLDVRNPDEWAAGTLPGVEKIALNRLPSNLARLDKSSAVLVVCHSGSRSQRAARFLLDQGFAKVANLRGGMKAVGAAR